MQPDQGTTTRVLNEGAINERIYRELLGIARARMAREHRLREAPESLVAEAWMRLSGRPGFQWMSRQQFYGYARRVMWQVCVEWARPLAKRPPTQSLPAGDVGSVRAMTSLEFGLDARELEALDRALTRLRQVMGDRQAEVVRLRFIEQRTEVDTAAILGVSRRTVQQDWLKARAWLHRELN